MSHLAISVENLSKTYRLGQISANTLTDDLKVWWARTRGKPNPLLKIGQTDYGNRVGEMIWALKDVSFQVEQGEVLGIIGRNGAGKSTLLKILSRVTAPTNGLVKVKGRISSLLEVGTGFHPDLTGRENIFLNGAILGMSQEEVKRKFDEIVNFAEIEQFIDTPVKRYSSGMYVRLAFAVAAHLESEIMLVDEVLAVGDAAFQRKCLGKMGDVSSKEGRTVLFVSHNMGAVRNLCNRGLLIKQGSATNFQNILDCINSYLRIEQESNLPQIRIPYRNDLPICLTFIKVVDQSDKIFSNYSYDEPVDVRIGLKVNQQITRIYIALHVLDNEHQTLLFSRNFESDITALSKKWERGEYTYRVTIPPNLLIPGTYALNIHIATSLPTKVINGADNVCSFEIVDKKSIRSQMGFPWAGKVCFLPEWKLIE